MIGSRIFSNSITLLALITIGLTSCQQKAAVETSPSSFQLVEEDNGEKIVVIREGDTDPVLVQNAKPGMRPYLHPIMAPDGKGALTQYSPGHHTHQTGLYWGFTRVNGTGAPEDTLKKWFYRPEKPDHIKEQIGRDFFHNNGDTHWKKVTSEIISAEGEKVEWRTVYHLLDENGSPILKETMHWSLQEQDGKFFIDLEWEGEALEDCTVNQFEYGGLFLRMPWKEGIDGYAVNTARQRNQQAEGKKAQWVNVGMEIEGREDWGHIAILDHSQNAGFPTSWRVDGQLGVGPCRAIEGDWHIPKGDLEIIRHRIIAYTGEFNDIQITDLWNDYVGAEGLYTTTELWRLAQEEGKMAKFLSPEEAVAEMTVTEGYQVNVFASEPMITQPMAFCWDDRGRMWIAENRDYEDRKSGFSNDGNSRILILEDTDRDGTADLRKVFAEGIPFPAAIAIGFDGLWLGAPPNLLFVPDRDGDDRADMDDIEVRLTGWGIRDRHETLNSFHWGPDGWLYGLEGFATPSKIHKPEGSGTLYGHNDPFPDVLAGDGVDINGGVWRYHPTKDRFEVVAHGFSNPWGIDYDSKGQLFITACVIPHMFHVIPGGIYHRQGGQHFNPYVYRDIRTIVDHSHRSAHGGARIYQSDAFPPEQYGRLFMANIHEHAVLSDILVPNGSGFIARHAEDFVLANNAQWIGFSMEIGPAGNLYVLDWHDADICGNSVMQKETGRVFRITPDESLAEDWEGRFSDLNTLSDLALADLQTSESNWHARRARLILQNRALKGEISNEAITALKGIFDDHENADYRLRALWALHTSQVFSSNEMINCLNDPDQHIRAWAIQFIGEDHDVPQRAIEKFTEMANTDQSPVVRLYLAAVLQRIEEQYRWPLLEGLLSNPEDADDHNIPLMIWFGLEPLVAENPEQALRLAQSSQIPLIAQFVTRRVVDADKLEAAISAIGQQSENQATLLEGLHDALEGRSDLKPPANWTDIYDRLSKNNATADLALAVAQQFGDSEAANRYLAQISDPNTSATEKNTAIRNLAAKKWAELENELPSLWDNPEVRIEAIRAIAAYDSYEMGLKLLEKYTAFSPEEKLEVVQAMASRSSYGNLITEGLKKEWLPRKDVPAYVARQLRRVVGNGFVEVWGPIDDLGIDKEAEMQRYKAFLTDAALVDADIPNGEAIFQRSCGACHQMYGEGGLLGPDLTGSNRTNLDYILTNMLDPSGEIQDDYRMTVITTRDGRTYAGNIATETDRQLTMRVAGQDNVIINKSEVQSQETMPVSMMPEGLLQTLTDQEVIDLVAYLRTQEDMEM